MRSILVHADRSAAMAARLETALGLAGACGGYLTVLVDTPFVRYVALDPMGGSYVASAALQQALDEDDAQAAALEAQLARQKVPFSVVRSEAEPVEALADAARLADVVVMSRATGLAGEVALAARAPVLVLRGDDPLAFPLTRASVAWDGGSESAMALRGALPLLARCPSVEVLTVAEKRTGLADDALRYLEQHGVPAVPRVLVRNGSTEATLARAAAESGAQLLVMGAYGRSRMRELLFGGVTRHFLEDESAPALLLAH